MKNMEKSEVKINLEKSEMKKKIKFKTVNSFFLMTTFK